MSEEKQTYYIVGTPFPDWVQYFEKQCKIKYVNDKNDIKDTHYKIISISVEQYKINSDPLTSVFINKPHDVDVLENKGMFAKFMQANFPGNIPKVCYYSFNDTVHINKIKLNKMIKKPIYGFGGIDVRIVHGFDTTEKNIVVLEYIEHSNYYTGHMLIHKGKILNKVYFYCNNNNKNLIKQGAIENYRIKENLDDKIDSSIFKNIFKKLNYSGFVCIDFTIHMGIIKIFEINPRPGGSLVRNEKYLNIFFDTIIENI
jgi:predicted ATP-grasp superfamily ATP-dependent carboligase